MDGADCELHALAAGVRNPGGGEGVPPGAVLRNRVPCHWGDDFPLLGPTDEGIGKLLACPLGASSRQPNRSCGAQLALGGESEAGGQRIWERREIGREN